MTFQHKFKPFYVIHNTFEQFLQSIPVIGFVESERKAAPAQECDNSHGQHQCRIEKEGEAVAVRPENMTEEVYDKRADHHGQVIHRHDERKGQRSGTRRGDGRRLVVNDRLHDPIAQPGAKRPEGQHRLAVENPDTQQPHTDQHERHEVDVPLQRTDNLVDEQPRQHDRKEKQRDQHPGKRVVYLVVVDQERGIERHDQHGVGGEKIEQHQPDELAAVNHLMAHLDALLRLGRGAAAPEEERQRERDARQGIDQERKMPVDLGQVARHGGRHDERKVVDRRTVPQLPDAAVPREIVDDQARREGDDHAGADTEDAADDDEPRHAAGEQAGHAAQKENRKSYDQDFEFVPPLGEFSGEQHEGDDQQRRQRGEHLDFEVARRRENRIQVAQNR